MSDVRASVDRFGFRVRTDVPPVLALSDLRVARAVRILFLSGFDTVEVAALFARHEPEIVALLHDAVGPVSVEVTE